MNPPQILRVRLPSPPRDAALRQESLDEESCGEPGYFPEGARLLEQVAGASHDLELVEGAQALGYVPVQLKHGVVVAADDEQRGRANDGERPFG